MTSKLSEKHVTENRVTVDYVLAVIGAILATGVGSVFVIGGLIDWTEQNITARTLWGVLAMIVSLLSPAYLMWLLFRRSSFVRLSAIQRWSVAVGIPLVLIAVPIALAVIGHFARKPILIP